MTEKKPLKVKLTKQAMDQLNQMLMEGTDEEVAELQQALDEFKKACEDGTILDIGEPIDLEQLKREEPEVYEAVMASMAEIEGKV